MVSVDLLDPWDPLDWPDPPERPDVRYDKESGSCVICQPPVCLSFDGITQSIRLVFLLQGSAGNEGSAGRDGAAGPKVSAVDIIAANGMC